MKLPCHHNYPLTFIDLSKGKEVMISIHCPSPPYTASHPHPEIIKLNKKHHYKMCGLGYQPSAYNRNGRTKIQKGQSYDT